MRLLLIAFLSTLSVCVLAQHTFSGVITDSETKLPVSRASLFFQELNRGSISGEDGSFHISGIRESNVVIEVSHVRYKTAFFHLTLKHDTLINISLVPSLIAMEEVIVTGSQIHSPRETSFNIVQLNSKSIQQLGSMNLSEAIATLPGISQLSTGPGISKPVIRGLYGNRIQVNLNGVRFDNQQWQDEHGLGLSDIGVDRVEIIRGPASVLYGSDALGGVVNIIDERPAPVDQTLHDLNVKLFSNTYGIAVNYGRRMAAGNVWKNFRIGIDNHADYSDGEKNRVLNSRFSAYNVKASWGRNKNNDVHVLNVRGSHSMFGFVFDSLTGLSMDRRLSRSYDGPHHLVSFAQVTTENSWIRRQKKIALNGGFVSNLRMEDEGGGGISLSMLLNTANSSFQITRYVDNTDEWIYGASFMAQSNTNFGGRTIVPDAINGEFALFTIYRHNVRRWLLEGGFRMDEKVIETFQTNILNDPRADTPTDVIRPFTNFYSAINMSLGTTLRINESLTWKNNVSTGYRPGNLAELSSNGLHEGSLRWEIGLPDAKIEQNLSAETSLLYSNNAVRASISMYRNSFRNYFYLSPTGEEFYGFQIYQFTQSNATLEGGEVTVDCNPGKTPLEFSASYSVIDARKSNGDYLPFIPANKSSAGLKYHFNDAGIKVPIAGFSVQHSFAQNRPAQFETQTMSYTLVDLFCSGEFGTKVFSVRINNLFNKNYYDHLSRFKYYGIAGMGRSIIVSINFKF